ncbi:DMT family transporter [Salibaculum griseiflavum]|nr:DMT family transporter [Salibaculum griseiflavum]
MLTDMSPALRGALSALIAVFCFSVNDMAIKFLSDGYALHQIVLIRSMIGIVFLLCVVVPLTGGLGALRTRRLGMHFLRGGCVVFANLTFFLGLASLPLAEGVAIFFVSPLIITVFSVIFLRETVGPWRWAAIAVGLVGVVVVLRPGTDAFRLAALLPMVAAVGYAALHMLTRYIGRTESAAAMSFYIQLTFIMVSAGFGLAFGDGKFAGSSDPSIAFMFRAWSWPPVSDLPILITVGVTSALGGFFISYAYRNSEAAIVAPFEYIALPLSILWGVLVFSDWPDGVALAGIILILAAGLFIIWRENRSPATEVQPTPRYRR